MVVPTILGDSMYYAAPTYRKGMAPHGHAGYGVVVGWVPKKKRLAKCPKMQYWYEKYAEATRQHKELPSFLGIRAGKKHRKFKKLRKKYERKGKAAWRECKIMGRSGQATSIREESEAAEMDAVAFAPADPMLPPPPPPPGSDVYVEEQMMSASPGVTRGPNYLLWGGLAGGGLLLALLLRRKK